MVAILAPDRAAIGVTHERTGSPLTWTVQAPHWAMPQPNFVPVRPSSSRSTHSSGVSGAAFTVTVLPLMSNIDAMLSPPTRKEGPDDPVCANLTLLRPNPASEILRQAG
jgi:hypothetical protein